MRKVPKHVINSALVGLGVGMETYGFLRFKHPGTKTGESIPSYFPQEAYRARCRLQVLLILLQRWDTQELVSNQLHLECRSEPSRYL
jgi:hypothetical protein